MRGTWRLRPAAPVVVGVVLLAGVGALLVWTGKASDSRLKASSQLAELRPTGEPQLVSIEPLPAMESDGEMCQWLPASAAAPWLKTANSQTSLIAELEQETQADGAASTNVGARSSVALERPPVRVIRDPFPTYSSVAVDARNNEIVLQDENLFEIMVYDRKTNTPAAAKMTEPKRIIGGTETRTEFNCGLYVDPKSGDIYSVNNDTLNTMAVFSRNARGNVRPDRQLHTPHGSYGIAVDEEAQELYLTVQHENAVVVYRKMAQGEEKALRTLEGEHTQLADPHGIALDTKNKLMFVSNHGSAKNKKVAGSGRFVPPSITVYPLGASGDTAPLRVIEGPATELNWPAHIYADEAHGEVFVANDAADSILVFRETDTGDAAPIRVLKGAKTQLKNPTDVFVDTVNDEVVVANMGNHRATVYHRTAQGDTPPVRTIRSAPDGLPALQIGNPGSVAYDSRRQAIIVPN